MKDMWKGYTTYNVLDLLPKIIKVLF